MDELRIEKSAQLAAGEITDDALAKINQYTLSSLTADQVYTFRATLCDSHIDRDFERFSDSALQTLRQMFIGKTVMKDHNPRADNQVARIYDTELISDSSGTRLIAYCYMVRTSGNADLIAEINGGIKKEGSISCAVTKRLCSVCGKNMLHESCRHVSGKDYERDGVRESCHRILDGIADAYEFSLVAIPAQKNAGIHKSAEPAPEQDTASAVSDKETVSVLLLRAKAAAVNAKYATHEEE